MKSQGEIEAAVCDAVARFQQEYMGRGPRDIHAHLLGTLLVVRLQGALTPAERQLLCPRHEPDGTAGKEPAAGPAMPGNGNGTSASPMIGWSSTSSTVTPRAAGEVVTASGGPER